jgi:PAS domain S-box-containing protein
MLFVGEAGSLKRHNVSQVAGFAAVTIAGAAIIGWWTGLPLLSSWGPGFAGVKPVAALCLAALGIALVCPGKNERLAVVFGLAVAAGAALDLGQDLFGFDFGVNRWLAPRAAVPVNGAASFRMITGTKLAMALAGGSLALSRFEGRQFTATVLGGLAGVIAMFGLLGCLTSIHTLYSLASIRPPALPTTVGLLCVAGAILLRVGTMPVLRKPRPLSHLLITLGGAIVALLLLFGFDVAVSVADMQVDQVRNELMSEARTLSAEIDREVVGEIERLQALAASPSLRHGDFAEFQRQAEASLALRQSGNIVLIDRDMQKLVNTWVPSGTSLEEAAVSEPLKKAFATGRPQVTGLFMGLATEQLFGIMVPVQIGGESRFALVRSPDRRALAGLVAAKELPSGWHAVVADAAHRIIARSEQENAFIGKELPPAQWHRAGRAGVFGFIDPEGRPSLQADAWSELTGWQTAVWAPKALLEAPIRAVWWTIGFATLLAFTLVVALASWLGRIIARSVGQAARAAMVLGEGAPLVLSGTPITEVDRLMAELRLTAVRQRTAEGLLRDSERQLRLVADNAPVAIAHCDAEARYKCVNRNYAKRWGLTPEQMVGKRVREAVGEKAWATFEPFYRDCLSGKALEFELEVDLPYPVSEKQFVHCCYEPEWKDGKIVGLIAAITNITRLKRAEAALRESEATFRAMFDVSSVGKIEVEPGSSRFLRANAAMCKFLGYSEEELLARTLLEITHPEDRDHSREVGRRLDTGESDVFDIEKRYVRKDGNAVWARATVNVVRDAFGRPLRNTAVIQDLNARKQAEQALQASKDRLQLAMHAARLGSWQYDPLRRVFSGDTRSREIFNVAEYEASLEEIIELVHPDDVEKVLTALEARLDPVNPNRSATEFRLRRGRGEVRWVETLGLAYFEGVGREQRTMSVVGTVADITERKQREEERREREEKVHLLMREVNHRAKNMLSVVYAIARQTAAKNPEDFIERFSERIQALSASQDLLVRNEWNGVEIEDLVRAQLAHLVDLIGSRIAVHGPKLRLKAASAQAIGLVLHELATNAGKYGALSMDTGRVDICWGTDGDTFTMSWVESDGPPAHAPKRRGFGTIVMEAMAEHSVDGTVDLDYAPSGVRWRLTCPAANALEYWGHEKISGDDEVHLTA